MCRHGENIYKRKDGRYEGRYVIGKNSNGTTKFGYVYGRQYNIVKQQLLQKKTEQMSNLGSCSSLSTTLNEWMEKWLKTEVRISVKSSSYQTYLRQFRTHIAPEIGTMIICRITSGDIQMYLSRLIERKLASSTIRAIFRLLNSAMQSAAEEEVIRRNPCRKIHLQKKESSRTRAFSTQEQKTILSSHEPQHLYALLAMYTGMRLGEICALKWSDVDWEKGCICVQHTVQRIRHCNPKQRTKTFLSVTEPKSYHSHRVIPLPSFLLDQLQTLFAISRTKYVFGTYALPADPRTIQRRFQRWMKKLNIPDAHFHMLRHSFATRMLELGIDIKTVSTLLGHASAKTTLDIYMHTFDDRQRNAMEKLAAYLV